MEFVIGSLNDLPEAAKAVLAVSASERIYLFYGEMGAGKTTLIQSLCAALGVREQVSSPTFSIVNEYGHGDTTVYHFDLYRLKHEAEALDFGIETYLDSGHYCFVEWPEKLGRLLPERFVKVSLGLQTGGARELRADVFPG